MSLVSIRRGERLVPLVLAVLAASCVVAAIEPWPVGVFQDDGIYAVLAKSLATGEGYRFLQMPGAPNATHYPPGYPLFLAALWKVYPQFPANVTLFKFANAVLLGIAAALSWRLARRAELTTFGAAGAVALFTACSPVVLLSVMVLSEPLFMACLIPVLLLSERALAGTPEDGIRHEPHWQLALGAGLAVGALAMVRTLGALVLPALVLPLLWQHRWRDALLVCAGGLVVLLPWQLWVGAHAAEVPEVFLGKYGSYTGWLVDAVRSEGLPWLLQVGWHNGAKLLYESWTHTGTILMAWPIRLVATAAILALFLPGLRVAFTRVRVTTLFVLAYIAMVLVWPFAPARFLWGIWPVMGLMLGLGAQWWWRLAARVESRAPRALVGAMVVALVAGYARFNVQSTQERWWTQVQGSVAMRAKPMAEWVNANTPRDAVLATDDDLLVYLYTGRRTVPNGRFTAQEHLVPQTPSFAVGSLRDVLQTYDVDFVLANTEYATYAVRGLIQASPPELRIVTALKRGAVFAPLTGLP